MKRLPLSLPPDHCTDCGQKFHKLNLLGFWAQACVLTAMLLLPAGCGVHKKMTVVSVAALVEDVAKASYKQSDLRLVREGMPAYLMLMDGMVEGWPDNERLLLAAAQAYSSMPRRSSAPMRRRFATCSCCGPRPMPCRHWSNAEFQHP